MAPLLRQRGVTFAVIGAAAMAVHGVSRSTRDVDLFTLAPDALQPTTWDSFRAIGIEARLIRGDSTDPLAGVVRFSAPEEHPVDLVIGRSPWQARVLANARMVRIEGVDVPVAAPADLILLKLYAGGPQDAWDIEQLLGGPDRAELVAEVDAALGPLPVECSQLWERVRGPRPA